MNTYRPGSTITTTVDGITDDTGLQVGIIGPDDTYLVALTDAPIRTPIVGGDIRRAAVTLPDNTPPGVYTPIWVQGDDIGPDEDFRVTTGYVAEDPTDWTPTPDEVGLLLRMRRNTRGSHEPVFTDQTDPTFTEVEGLIGNALDLVNGKVGIALPEAVWPMARRVVALRAALSIEPGSRDFNPERIRELRAQYTEELAALVEAAQDAQAGGDPGQVDDRALPVGVFPPAPCADHVPGTEIPYFGRCVPDC